MSAVPVFSFDREWNHGVRLRDAVLEGTSRPYYYTTPVFRVGRRRRWFPTSFPGVFRVADLVHYIRLAYNEMCCVHTQQEDIHGAGSRPAVLPQRQTFFLQLVHAALGLVQAIPAAPSAPKLPPVDVSPMDLDWLARKGCLHVRYPRL